MSTRIFKTTLACILLLLLQCQRSQANAISRALQSNKTECLCDAPPPFEEAVANTDTVLRVRVKRLKEKKSTEESQTYVALVNKVFKGSIEKKRLEITVDTDPNSCGYFSLKNGTKYLIFQDGVSNNNKFSIGRCFWDAEWPSVSQERRKFLKDIAVVPVEPQTQRTTFLRTSMTEPLPAVVRIADETVTKGYTNCSELEQDLEQALRVYTSDIILSNKYELGIVFFDLGSEGDATDDGEGQAEEEITEDSFGTNNQIEGVDEADIVKSDGTYVYLAYGDTLIVWNATSGEEVTRAVMPRPEAFDRSECRNSFDACKGRSYATINGILLQGNRLVLIVSGYTYYYYPYFFNGGERGVSALSDYGASSVRVYDIGSLGDNGSLVLLGTKELKGIYDEGRSIGTKAHIATSTKVNTYAHISRFLNRWNEEYDGMNSTEYEKAAIAVAEEIVPLLASRVVAELDDDGQCGGITKLAAYVSADFEQSLNGDGEITNEESRHILRDALSFRSIVIVTSFDMNEDFGALPVEQNATVPKISTQSGAAFFGEYGPSIITASKNRMIFTANGYHWDEETWSSSTYTFVLVFTLPSEMEAGAAEASGFAVVKGRPINDFALNEHKDHLRVATTLRARWGCVEFGTNEEYDFRYCARWGLMSDVANQVIIFKYPSANETVMKETGRVEDLGKPGESLFAVRFEGDKAFAVTFERIDPFYTLDLSDPEKPFAAGELEITGFSTYLHLIEDDNFVLAVGQEANENGRILGVAVSLFNVTNFTDPTLAARYVVEDDPNLWSYSSASFDYKAFRYLEESGVLLLPITTYGRTKEDFQDGFMVIRVKPDVPSISFKFFIDHAALRPKKFCYSRTYLSSRSLVFKGKATTLKGHSVMSTDLNTNETRWLLDLDEDRDAEECFGWF